MNTTIISKGTPRVDDELPDASTISSGVLVVIVTVTSVIIAIVLIIIIIYSITIMLWV